MRFVTYLACATLVARASYEEDDDLLMIRGLQSNSSNATTTTMAPSSSNATTTTMAPSSSNATTTTMAPSSSNATTTTAAPTTTAASSEVTTTAAATGGASTGETTTGAASAGSAGEGTKKAEPTAAEAEAADAEMKALADFQAANNGTDLAEAIEVSVEAATEAKDPFHCWLETTESEACKKEKADAAAAGSSSNSTRRTLAATDAVKKAHNVFCGAFSFASSYSVCDALGESSLTTFFQGATKAAAMDNCATGLSGAYIRATSNGHCSDDTGDGVCFVNELYSQNTPTKLTAAETHACTRAVGTSSTKEFKTKTSMKLPKWKATKESVTIDATTIESTAKTNVAANSELLQTALVVSAVAIHKDPALSAVMAEVPVKSSLGLTDEAFTNVVNAIGTGDINVSASTISSPSGAGNAALGTALGEAKTLVKAQYTVEDKSGGGSGGSTSGTTAVMAMSSVAIGFLGLVF